MAKIKEMREREKASAPLPAPGSAAPRLLALAAILVIITLAAFWSVRSASFVRMDDNVYVTENARVQAGLTWENVRWAFSTTYFGFYYPLTWLSHMLDCQLYGSWAGGHHLTSLLLHVLNCLLLFAFLARATGSEWKSFFVAALFAVHPLHVESVAWISERKDVLSTLFWFLCLLAYVLYTEKPSLPRYALVFFSFLLGLMAKSMLVTLPFTLLLLDYWPLGRSPLFRTGNKERGMPMPVSRLLIEKLPLFALIPIFSYLTLTAQKQGKALFSFGALPFSERVANSLISYAFYIKKMFLPFGLTALYPLPDKGVSIPLALFCGLFLAALTLAVLLVGKRKKYLAAGWFWYLGTLVPVIGLVQVGVQSMADRYSYVSFVGLFIIMVWGAGEIAEIGKPAKILTRLIAVAALAAFMLLTRLQTGYWNDSVALYSRMLEVTKDNCFAHNNLGVVLSLMDKQDEAMKHFEDALRINPNYADAHNNLGYSLYLKGRKEEARGHYVEALRINPDYTDAQVNLGSVLADLGRNSEAIVHYEKALNMKPDSAKALNDLGLALAKEGRLHESIERFRESIKIEPDFYDPHNNLGTALAGAGRPDEAIEEYLEALRIRPASAEALNNLGLIYARAGRMEEAVARFSEAVKAAPEFPDAHVNLGVAMLQENRNAEAVKCFQQALKLRPDSELARANLETAEKNLRARPE